MLTDAEKLNIHCDMNLIQANTTLTARSICNQDCIFSIKVVSRTAKRATFEEYGKLRTSKIHTDAQGNEFLRPDSYSMAPTFRA